MGQDIAYYLILFVCFVLVIIAAARKPDTPPKYNDTDDIEDDFQPMSFHQEEESDGDYWCPLCGYHATKEGYYTAHLMNEHK